MPARSFPDVSPATRKVMQANKGKDTKPELVVRQLVHGMGYRYRLHRKDLPGKPDLAFGPRKAIIEVRGCFWHGHNCKLGHVPQSRQDYWGPKIAANQTRDKNNLVVLANKGWRVLEVWECKIPDRNALKDAIREFLISTEPARPALLPAQRVGLADAL